MEIAHGQFQKNSVRLVASRGNPVTVGRRMEAICGLESTVKRVEILGWIGERVSFFPYLANTLVDNLKAKSLIRIAPRGRRSKTTRRVNLLSVTSRRPWWTA